MIPTMDRPSRSARTPALWTWTAALLVLCAVSLWLRFHHIDATLPYPHHIDEPFVTGPAARTLVTGTLHPYTFNYPSLPKYLAAAGMAGGFVRSAARREVRDVAGIGSVGYPHYDAPRVVQGAKQLFALLSVIALAATGYAAWLAAPTMPAAVLLAPLALAASPLFFSDSWRYLNVDIVGASFGALTIAACLRGSRDPSIVRAAVVPGMLAGLTAGSKYTLALVIVPVLLGIAFYVPQGRRLRAALAALASMSVAFVAVVPYSLIDIPGFLNGLAAEAAHYAGGHAGYEANPGLAQLRYYGGHFVSDFGVPAVLLAGVGLAVLAAADWRRALVLASFPVALLALLASQRVHFARNVLALHPVMALLLGWGAIAVWSWLVAWTARRGWAAGRVRPWAIAGVTLAVGAAAVPPLHVADQFRDRTDSRKLAQAWFEEKLPKGWAIVVPGDLGLDLDALMKATGRKISVIDLKTATDRAALDRILEGVPKPAIIMLPRWGADVRFSGAERADALNAVASHWRIVTEFGANPVLVNYSQPVPSGNPAFALAVLER
jgi:hypothetical protein